MLHLRSVPFGACGLEGVGTLSPLPCLPRNTPTNCTVASERDGALSLEKMQCWWRQVGMLQQLLLLQPSHNQWGLAACSESLNGGSMSSTFIWNEIPNKATYENKSGISGAASNRIFKAPESNTSILCKSGHPQTQIWILVRRLGNHPGQ